MTQGYVAMVLHAHLPYIRHPEQEGILEERWLFEAISEAYIPLINYFQALIDEGVDFRITMSLTPPLISMLSDSLLQERYINYLEKQIELSRKEIERTKDQPAFRYLAETYYRKYNNDLKIFRDMYSCNIITAFKNFQDMGKLELIACAATHAYLPLMDITPEAIRAQIAVGVKTYEKYFAKKPKGIWLPECGYIPAVETALKAHGIEYIITESHGILYANPRPVFGTYLPIVTHNGIVAFGRDFESSRQVWSSTEGYPGDFDYREFYRDIGFDLDHKYIKDYILGDGVRIQTGIKYYRITGRTEEKQPYNPEWARNKAELHAHNFMSSRKDQIQQLNQKMGRPPIIVCPYDAELFGHWWFEGTYWLYILCKKIYYNQRTFKLTTLGEYIAQNPIMQVSSPCASSWGHKGYNEVWLNESNDWIYKHLHKAVRCMVELANENPFAEGVKRQALNQAARELMLAQSSDWAFIMKTGTTVQYAEKRIHDHIKRFTRLYHDFKEDNIDETWLMDIQAKDNIFPDMDFKVYSSAYKDIYVN